MGSGEGKGEELGNWRGGLQDILIGGGRGLSTWEGGGGNIGQVVDDRNDPG